MQVVAELTETALQFAVPRPGTHIDHVLQHQPPGTQCAGVPNHQQGGGAARFITRRGALGTGVAGAFRRCQQDVDAAHAFLQGTGSNVFQASGDDLSVREVGGEGTAGSGAYVDAGGYLHARRAGAGAAAAGAAEHIKSSNRHCLLPGIS